MDIRGRVMSALRWSAAARFFGQAFSWTITILVIRLLAPGDYGLMAMGVVLVSFLFLLNTLGLDAILVQEEELAEETRRQIFGVVILANCVCFLLLFFGAGMAAEFYGEAQLEPIVQVLSLQFLILVFETLPQSKLEREIEFARRSVVDFSTLVLGSLVTLTMALLDYGVWALVWGMVANTLFRVIGLNLITNALVWPSFSLTGMSARFSFGALVSTDRGLWFVFSESDKFIGGKLLGQHALGYYAVARQIASLPIQKLAGLLNAIAFPAFSRANEGRANAGDVEDKVRDYLLTATRILSIAAFPVFFGLSCTSDVVVEALLGDKWLRAAPLLQLLALVMPFQLLNNVFSPLLWGIGKPATSASNYAIAAIFMPLAFFGGAKFGVLGLAYAWLAMYPVVFVITAYRSCSAVGISLLKFMSEMIRPVVGSLIMYACVVWVGAHLAPELHIWLRLAALVGCGALAYALAMLVMAGGALRETWSLLKS